MAEKTKGSPISWNLVLICATFLIGGAFFAPRSFLDGAEDILIPIFGMLSVTAWIALPLWFAHKRKLAKEQAAIAAKDPAKSEEFQVMKQRLENLEMVLCNLDREINSQLEKSLSSQRLVTSPEAAGSSQMPTTFMNVASALEGRYQILKELGRGGMGIVFQAYDKQLKEQVAIKIISPLLSNDQEAVERLKREVSAARRITHPNVIRIHDIAEAMDLHYVSMEYFPGKSLKEHIRQSGPLSLMAGFQIAAQVCDGLEAAHRGGIVHRDLKSQNIIIDPSGTIKIIDFGLALTAHLQGMTATGLIMGTPEYMAPEQVAGKRVDERADIYSLGIILYEIFTGRVPFTGDTAIAVGFKQMNERPQFKSTDSQVPEALQKIIKKALEKEPSQRYGSVAELKADLETAVRQPLSSLQTEASEKEFERVKN